MLEFLRDPIWQFIGAAIALFAIVVAVIAIKLQLIKKSLSYSIFSSSLIFYVFSEEHRPRLRILYDDKEVQDLRTVDLVVQNDGNIPILQSDFSIPIAVSFPEWLNVLGVAVTEVSPNGLQIKTTQNENGVIIEPTLLNPKDRFSMRFIVESNEYLSPTVRARIVGIHEIHRKPHSDYYRIGNVFFGFGWRIFRIAFLIIGSGVALNFLFDFIIKLLKTL